MGTVMKRAWPHGVWDLSVMAGSLSYYVAILMMM